MHSCLISHSIKYLIGIINRRKHKINKLKVVSSKTFVCQLQQKFILVVRILKERYWFYELFEAIFDHHIIWSREVL